MNKGILIIPALLFSLNLHPAEVKKPLDKFEKSARTFPQAAGYEQNSFRTATEKASWGDDDGGSGSLRGMPDPGGATDGKELGAIGEAVWFLLGAGLLYGFYKYCRKRQIHNIQQTIIQTK
jgi:hypothetical protein